MRKFSLGTLNRKLLVMAISDETAICQKDVDAVVQSMMDVVVRTVAAGQNVTLTNFGTWMAVEKEAKLVRNPQTGEQWISDPYQGIRWRSSPRFARIVRQRNVFGTARKLPKTRTRKG